jgi:hypothetical protein
MPDKNTIQLSKDMEILTKNMASLSLCEQGGVSIYMIEFIIWTKKMTYVCVDIRDITGRHLWKPHL